MASSSHKLFFFIVPAIFFFFFSLTTGAVHYSNNASTTTTFNAKLSSIRSFCRTTPHPQVCFNSLKLSISINISPNILNYLIQSLQVAISEATKLSNQFHNINAGKHSTNIIEKQRGALQDCRELHQSTLASLKRSLSWIRSSHNSRNLVDARAYLSAAVTNKNTCLEGLDSASGTLKPVLVNSVINTYKHVSNPLSMLSNEHGNIGDHNKGHNNKNYGILDNSDGEEYDPNEVLVVAADGTGNFSTITEAINFAPNNSMDHRTVIYVKEGVYEENVEIPSYKTNIVMLGDGSDVTVITGNRSVVDGWTTFRSATLGEVFFYFYPFIFS